MNSGDLELLRQYARRGSEEAFATLVGRHLNLVYSVALRVVRSPHLAEEVAQSVFTDLARNADKMKPDTILTAWLYRVAYRTAVDVVRRESRRQNREQQAVEMATMNSESSDWTHIEPLLDEGMQTLDEADRAAVLLRYFDNKSLREVGQRLGVSDDAAQKRVSRAVDHLREFYSKRGIAVEAGGVVVALSANAVQAAPAGLAAAISAAAVLGGTTSATATAIVTKAIAMTTLQKSLMTAAIVVLVGAGIYEAHKVAQQPDRVPTLQQEPAPQASMPSVSQSVAPLPEPPASPTQTELTQVMAAPPAAAATNAADLYRKAFALYDALTDEEKKACEDWKAQTDDASAARLCEKLGPILAPMREATASTNCDWGLGPVAKDDKSLGATLLPVLNRSRLLARTAAWSAAHCHADDPHGATEDVLATLQIGHNVSQSLLLGFLTDTAIQGISMAIVAENAWRVVDTDRGRLIEAFNDPQYQEDLYRAIEREAESVALRQGGNQLPNGATSEMNQQVAEFEREFAKVLTQPDPQYQAWLSRAQAAQDSNPLLKGILPGLEATVDKARAAVVYRTMASAGLAEFQSGQEALSTYADPATGQPFGYRLTADGFQLRSVYQLQGQPVTMTFRRQKNGAPSN